MRSAVASFPESLYAEWRARTNAFTLALQEKSDIPPERLLQAIWHHQRVRRDDLKLADGRPLRVLHPGFWNHAGGPDFCRAVLQFAGEPPFVADVEIDLVAQGWRAHGHDSNPTFRDVRLHIIWDGKPNDELPTLVLKPALDAPLPELALWLNSETAKRYPENLLGLCASPLRDLSDGQMEQLLNEAALIRLQRKACDLQARARQVGWEQSLWEGLLRALGYKQNIWPMQRIGELRERIMKDGASGRIACQARLLGVAGLLPADLSHSRGSGDGYLRKIWDCWWRERDEFSDCALPQSLWRFHGLRPANHPQRRLALAAQWWREGTLVGRLEKWFNVGREKRELLPSLLLALQTPADEFWSWHWTFRSERMSAAQPLLGPTRVTDLAINVVLPWLWVRAREGQNATLQARAEQYYFLWPAAEDNAVLRLARGRLLGGRSAVKLHSAATQQGLLQVVRDFCDESNPLCIDCKFPALARNWKVAAVSESSGN